MVPALSAAAAVLAGAAALTAQGSSVYTQSACASARGGAAVAAPCGDGSSVYYNPAALALMGSVLSAGFTAVHNAGDFTYDSTGAVVERPAATPLVPHAYASYRLGDRWAAGLGLWAPYGLGIEWPETFEGRFISWKTELQGLYLQPTAAYQLIPGRLAIGAGVDVIFGSIELNRAIDAPLESPQLALIGVPLGTDIARAELAGSGVGVGGHLALYYVHSDRLTFGARYMHGVDVGLEGDAEFDPVETGLTVYVPNPATGEVTPTPLDALVAPSFDAPGPLADQAATADLSFPAQAVVGARIGATPRLDLALDYQWTGWSAFDRIAAEFEYGERLVLPLGYEDTHTLRVGADYSVTAPLDVRAGFTYNTAASPDRSVTPILPEAERALYTIGIGYDHGRLGIDGFYNYVDQADRRGRVRSEVPSQPSSLVALNTGVYTSQAHLFGITLSYRLGEVDR